MLRFSFFGFPVVIHWTFWLSLAFVGGLTTANTPGEMQQVLVWMGAGCLSVFIHELGHALTMHYYGARQVHIFLQGFGGYAISEKGRTRSEDFFVTLAGPFIQIAAGVVMWWLMDVWLPDNRMGVYFMSTFVKVSLFWAILNLFPVIPLDGGHLMRAVLGPRHLKIVLIISMVCAIGLSLLCVSRMVFIGAFFFGLFAFNNFKQLRGEPPSMMP